MRFRYVDLRRTAMYERLRMRSRITRAMREFLDDDGFLDIETPMLTKATPEGARDYLVPSRTQPGTFFALPQSPQIFKQLLMMSGMERYYQIARCFRDEDLRADRQPEFTQLDIEVSFLSRDAIMDLCESLMRQVFARVLEVALPDPFPRMRYEEAKSRYGTDRPDLRNPLELVEVADLVRDSGFKVFSGPAGQAGGRVAALRAPGGSALPRSVIDDYTRWVGAYGARGLAYIKVNQRERGREGMQSPIVKFLSDAAIAGIVERTGAQDGDLLFFGADRAAVVDAALGALRNKVAQDLGLAGEGWHVLWVTDFPMFERNEAEGRWEALHHPFTAPDPDDVGLVERDPGALRSQAYDMVLNGAEIGGGVGAHPSPRDAGGGAARARDRRRGGRGSLRAPARRPALRLPAPRRHRFRTGSHRDADDRIAVDPRGDRVPQDPERSLPADRSAGSRKRASPEGARDPDEGSGVATDLTGVDPASASATPPARP